MTLPSAPIPVETVAGRRVLFVMATQAEYGPELRARIRMFNCGVGPVESGVALAAALAATPVDLVVSLGSAGSARLDHCGLYQASAVAYRDMDASPLGFPRGQTPFLDLPPRIALPLRLPDLPAATLSTGGAIVSGPAYAAIPEDMVDMETWALLRACMTFGRPLIGLRGISDGQAELTGLHDWTEYLPIIDTKLAGAVDLIARELAAGRLV